MNKDKTLSEQPPIISSFIQESAVDPLLSLDCNNDIFWIIRFEVPFQFAGDIKIVLAFHPWISTPRETQKVIHYLLIYGMQNGPHNLQLKMAA